MLCGNHPTADCWEGACAAASAAIDHKNRAVVADRKWGSAYLTRDFFLRLSANLGDRVLLICAFECPADDASITNEDLAARPERMVAAALNLVGSHAIYGRNWGCARGTHYKHLHFELCYYQVCAISELRAGRCRRRGREARRAEPAASSPRRHCCPALT